MSHVIAAAAAAHPTPATTAEGVGIIALFLIVAVLWLARRWREARRENVRMEAWRATALAQAKDQYRQDIAVARANVRDLETR